MHCNHCLATKKLPRLHIVARRLLERGSTHRVVVRQMERAVEGYIPKGDFERIDYQEAYVALALGGQGVNHFYLFADATHLLEQIFGILRTLCGPQRNFDMVQLEDRISTVVRLYEIYLERPEWREKARRFGESTDHWNTRSWTGSVDPSLVNLKNSWATGQKRAITALRKSGVDYASNALNITKLLRDNPRLSLLNWDGKADATAADDDDDDA